MTKLFAGFAFVALLTLGVGAQAASIAANPSTTSTDGNFTLTWDQGYELRAGVGSVRWRYAAAPTTQLVFSGLPSGVYKFQLWSCVGSTCTANAATITVTVTRAPELAIDTATSEAGTTDYRATVTNRGASNISVPLKVLPGRYNSGPELSLEYDSARGSDIAYVDWVDDSIGYGWQLKGLSRIHRCRAGVTPGGSPGSAKPILDSTDRLCLDGMPLVAVSGTYWQAGAIYRTAVQTNIIVRQMLGGTSPNTYDYFNVEYPDGGVAQFGGTADSRLIASGKTATTGTAWVGPNPIYIWGVNSTTKVYARGVTIYIEYESQPDYGMQMPKRITYGGAEIQFKYGPRDDLNSIAVGVGTNSGVRRISSLHTILVLINGVTVREYRFDSNVDSGSRVRLENVQECGYDEAGNLDACLRPLTFGWGTVSSNTPNHPIAITSLTDGLGAQTQFLYTFISSGSNPLNYAEAPFGATMSAPNTTTQNYNAVSEMRVADGLTPTGTRRFTYAYKEFPRYNSLNRGFIGFYEMRVKDEQPIFDGTYDRYKHTYTQMRLDFPFLGAVSQTWSMNAAYNSTPAPSEQFARQEIAYTATAQTGGAQYVSPARIVNYQFEGNTTIGGSEEEIALCFIALSGSTCPTSGTSNEYITKRTSVLTTGNTISGSGTSAFWGDVPNRIISGTEKVLTTETQFRIPSGSTWSLVPTKRTVSHSSVPNETNRAVVQTYEYIGVSPILYRMTRLPGDLDNELKVERTFDYLNGWTTLTETLSGAHFSTRTTNFSSPLVNGSYVAQISNPLSQPYQYDYDLRFGAVKEDTDPNGHLATTTYDTFGRVIERRDVGGDTTTVTYARCDAGCTAVVDAVPAMKVTTETKNGGVQVQPTQVRYLDVLGREVLTEVETLDAADGWRSQRTVYDKRGHVRFVTIPYFSNQTPSCTNAADCTQSTYDLRGRLTLEQRPDGGSTATTFGGASGVATATVTESVAGGAATEQRKRQSSFNVLGQVTSSIDAYLTGNAITTNYDYDAQGNLDDVKVNNVQIANMTYDLVGNRKNLVDANLGTWTFNYDALGNLTQVTDAKAQVTSYVYDVLNRRTSRTDLNGSATWNWDDATFGIGKLESRSSPGFTETYSYRQEDSKLGTIVTDIDVAGVTNGVYTYTRDFGYDAYGRLETVAYPSGSTFTHVYNGRGYAIQVKSGTTILENVQDTDAFDQATVTSFANTLKTVRGYDALTGRLTSVETGLATDQTPKSLQDLEYRWRSNSTLYQRIDKRDTGVGDDYTDTFSYDPLERITTQGTSIGANRTLSFAYNAYGNLTDKSSNVTGDVDVTSYVYQGAAGKPHRLATVTIGGVANTLNYDSNGSIIKYIAADDINPPLVRDDIDLAYDRQNRVTSITVGTTPTAKDEFWYDPDGQRFLGRQSWQAGGTQQIATTVYLGNFAEVIPPSGGANDLVQRTDLTPSVRHFHTHATGGGWSSRFEYAYRDHLDSLDALTDSSGILLNNKTSYDAFGGRREANWTSDITTASMNTILTNHIQRFWRGYTDHEQLNRTGFIHMNGRVYDPRIGRFVSADPNVQSPFYSQSYNPYSYVMNSPLSYTDPTGFFCLNLDFGFGLGFSACSDFGFGMMPYPGWAGFGLPDWGNFEGAFPIPITLGRPQPPWGGVVGLGFERGGCSDCHSPVEEVQNPVVVALPIWRMIRFVLGDAGGDSHKKKSTVDEEEEETYPLDPEQERNRCIRVVHQCQDECSERWSHLTPKPRDGFVWIRRCTRQCVEDHECFNY